ncbi:gag-asp_proteas domain-containing protein [Gossypium australe]|uniref:Gag-asp_proteas domain-containing protein n=1 Tax=Gossypium australe TaxID=47621 RepID=A0A5B6US53_9ROSI|nr:gag-asp_proteas domain-containing protein [Gossypium australe]
MPNYVKFKKDILSKRRLGEFEIIALTKWCNSFLQDKLPPKMKDPKSFTIPCNIEDTYCRIALCDLGASTKLMLKSIFKQLGIGEVRPTTVTLQLADRSLAHPDGKIEDVLVRVDKSFLAICKTLIDMQKGEPAMRVHDDKVTFNVFKVMKFPNEVEECSTISMVDYLVSTELEHNSLDDPLEHLLLFDSLHKDDENEYLAWLEANLKGFRTIALFD